ncbi:MAG: GerMN domain-containing protein [Spirochaetaceae bacterium]|jgi:spore germination protein GerM|nr:GerMN domain-containing protein [Spirochaetaceae bacterium]GMO20643.1 MAG: GerMN domain-containing protein [Termitinemataceae bacterium]
MSFHRKKRRSAALPKTLLFWAAFFIVVVLLFIINAPKITRTWQNVFGDKKNPVDTERQVEPVSPVTGEAEGGVFFPQQNIESVPPGARDIEEGGAVAGESSAHVNEAPGAALPAEDNKTRERIIYLVKVDSAGLVFINSAKRQVPVNESPLVTTLNVLLRGPSAEEKRQGLITLIPEGTKVLSAAVERNTAIINFNENFIFNNFGAEGYIAQLKQVIWTATEFPNINEVQINIEGKTVEYLGETIRLDRPRSRDSF